MRRMKRATATTVSTYTEPDVVGISVKSRVIQIYRHAPEARHDLNLDLVRRHRLIGAPSGLQQAPVSSPSHGPCRSCDISSPTDHCSAPHIRMMAV
jgi:hypothetical protein